MKSHRLQERASFTDNWGFTGAAVGEATETELDSGSVAVYGCGGEGVTETMLGEVEVDVVVTLTVGVKHDVVAGTRVSEKVQADEAGAAVFILAAWCRAAC